MSTKQPISNKTSNSKENDQSDNVLLDPQVVDGSLQPCEEEFEPVDGGVRAWLVCVTSFWCNGTLFGILNIFGLLFVALKEEFERGTDEDLAFKICKDSNLHKYKGFGYISNRFNPCVLGAF